jgi:alkanesulfonate monooxygenase SsuD/methylene tetrahydromethanopterin reductase-like flavin-dependent oxidoreductase (luciferase family)
LWISLAWLASHTQRIEFGPLVTPLSFRNPALTARMAAAVDDLSNGRLVLGLGAGWQEREHTNYGFDLLGLPERFDRFEEGLEVVTRLLSSDTPVDFQGKYFQLKEGILLPRPQRPGGPPILIGGRGPAAAFRWWRVLPWWNALEMPIETFLGLNQRLNELLAANGRRPETVRRSLMTNCCYGEDESEVLQKISTRNYARLTLEDFRQRGAMVGTASQLVEQLGRWAEAGVQRVMLQWLDLDDLDGLESIAAKVLPHVS